MMIIAVAAAVGAVDGIVILARLSFSQPSVAHYDYDYYHRGGRHYGI